MWCNNCTIYTLCWRGLKFYSLLKLSEQLFQKSSYMTLLTPAETQRGWVGVRHEGQSVMSAEPGTDEMCTYYVHDSIFTWSFKHIYLFNKDVYANISIPWRGHYGKPKRGFLVVGKTKHQRPALCNQATISFVSFWGNWLLVIKGQPPFWRSPNRV